MKLAILSKLEEEGVENLFKDILSEENTDTIFIMNYEGNKEELDKWANKTKISYSMFRGKEKVINITGPGERYWKVIMCENQPTMNSDVLILNNLDEEKIFKEFNPKFIFASSDEPTKKKYKESLILGVSDSGIWILETNAEIFDMETKTNKIIPIVGWIPKSEENGQ